MTLAYAVKNPSNEIDINTVSSTKRAAMVNWLVVHAVMVFQSTTDAQIFTLWEGYCGSHILIQVEVKEI